MNDNGKRKLEMEENNTDNGSENEENPEEMNTSNEDNNENDDIQDHLRQFDVLDEVQGDDSGSENGDIDRKGNEIILDLYCPLLHCICVRSS